VSTLASEDLADDVDHVLAQDLVEKVEAGETSLDLAQHPVDIHPGTGVSLPPEPRTILEREAVTNRERILFVCTANIDRSRTAEDLYRDDERYEVRSAGLAPFATVLLTRDLLLWADRVFVMSEEEDQHRTLIRIRFPEVECPVVDLEVPDRWHRGDRALVDLLKRRLRPHLGSPRPRAKSGIMDAPGTEG